MHESCSTRTMTHQKLLIMLTGIVKESYASEHSLIVKAMSQSLF